MKRVKNKKEKAAMPPEEMVCVESSDKKEVVCTKGGEVVKVEAKESSEETGKKRANLWIGTVNFFASPYQGLKESYEKKYGQAKKLFIVDLVLLGVIGLLFGFNIYLFLTKATGGFSWLNLPKTTTPSVVSAPATESLLKTEMKINGEAQANLNPGEDIEYTVSYFNSGKIDLYDIAVKVELEGAPVDLDQFSSGRGVLRGGAVVWTKDQVPEFSKLSSGESGELKFKVSTSQSVEPAKALSFGNILKSWLEISYKLDNNFGETSSFKSEVREDTFNSDLVLGNSARYYTAEGDQLGFGPLPPKVGEQTRYWVFWSVNNNLNDLNNVFASATLPSNVSWTGRISVTLGELNYNSGRHQVNWKVGDVGRYTGEEWPTLGVAFELALTPTAEQLGSEPVLLDQIKIFGKDVFTEKFLEKEELSLTTHLIYDNMALGKSKVQK